jgi:hypothetical protein
MLQYHIVSHREIVFLAFRENKFIHVDRTGSGVNQISYIMGTGGSFSGLKQTGREIDHSPPTNAEVKKIWIYTSTPPYVFKA